MSRINFNSVAIQTLGTLGFVGLINGCVAPEPKVKPGLVPDTAHVWIGGDVFVARGESTLWTFRRAGPGIINLEGPIWSAKADYSGAGRWWLGHHPEVVSALVRSGVGAVGTANNHSNDAGKDGRDHTVRILRSADLTVADGPSGASLTVDGHQVGIAAIDLHNVQTSGASTVGITFPPSDFRIALLHETAPGDPVEAVISQALEAGANLVAVTGRHKIDRLVRRDGAVIAYGLGDLALHCRCSQATDGLVLDVILGTDPPVISVLPIRVGRPGVPAHLHPHPDQVFDQLEALGTRGLIRGRDSAAF